METAAVSNTSYTRLQSEVIFKSRMSACKPSLRKLLAEAGVIILALRPLMLINLWFKSTPFKLRQSLRLVFLKLFKLLKFCWLRGLPPGREWGMFSDNQERFCIWVWTVQILTSSVLETCCSDPTHWQTINVMWKLFVEDLATAAC